MLIASSRLSTTSDPSLAFRFRPFLSLIPNNSFYKNINITDMSLLL